MAAFSSVLHCAFTADVIYSFAMHASINQSFNQSHQAGSVIVQFDTPADRPKPIVDVQGK